MEITALIRDSLIDFPGRNSLVVFSRGCNFKCPYCYANEVFNRKKCIEAFDYIGDWTDGVVLLGGEPTIHKNIFDFTKKLRLKKMSIKLDTNGSNPETIKKLIDEKLVDYIAMDIKTCPENYPNIVGVPVDINKIEESIKIISGSGLPYEFRTTIIPLIDENKHSWISVSDMKKIAEWIIKTTNKKDHKYFLQKFVARNASEMLSIDYSIEKLPEDFHETPIKVLRELGNSIKDILPNTKVRGDN